MQTIALANGIEMPILGFGVFQIPEADCEATVLAALEAGYRSLDTAASYGNERAVGRAIAASGIPRDELFVTTKLWIQDQGEAAARAAFGRSLDRLGLDRLDLYLIHQPYGDVYGSWRAMAALQAEGLTRAIGVSNFHQDRLADLAANSGVVPAVNQVECHPFHQRVADQAYMESLGIRIESWGPFAEGRNNVFSDPVLSRIAEAHDRTVGQVVLRWLVQRGVIVIPKSVRPERMAENLDVFTFALTDADMAAIAALEGGASLFFDHRDPAMVTALSSRRMDI